MSVRFLKTKHEGIFLHAKSGKYWIRDTVHGPDLVGRFTEKSLKTNSITLALERARAIKKKIEQGESVVASERKTFDDAFTAVLEVLDSPDKDRDTFNQAKSVIDLHLRPWFKANCPYLEGGCKRYKEGFLKEYERVWADYKREASGRTPPSYFQPVDSDGPKKRERKAKSLAAWLAKPSSQRPRKLSHDRRFLIMALLKAERRDWIRKIFRQKDFELEHVTDPIGKYVEEEDQRKLVLASHKHEYRSTLKILMALTMGMRKSEIGELELAEVSLEKKEIDLNPHRLKIRQPRQAPIPISDDVFPLLKRAYDECVAAGGRYLFPARFLSVEGQPVDWHKPQNNHKAIWTRIRKDAGVKCRFHDLKHTCVTNLMLEGVPDTANEKITGTSRETLKRIYAHIEQKMRAKFRSVFAGKYPLRPEEKSTNPPTQGGQAS